MKKFNEIYHMSSITMNIVDGCNLKCKYCFEKDKAWRFMSPENAVTIFRRAYEGFEENFPELDYFMVNLFGGEPTLNWPVVEALTEYINSNHCKARIGITTNLTKLDDKAVRLIEDNEIFLLVSIDGIKSVHDKNRSNSYDTVIKNLAQLEHADLLYLVEARMTVLPEDVEHLAEGVIELYEFGIQNIAPVPVTDVLWTEEQLKRLGEETDKLFDFYMELADHMESKKNIAIKLLNDYIERVLEPMNTEVQPCMAGTTQWCSIGIDGEIMPCHQRHTVKDHQDELRIGNIIADELDETKIVNSNRKVQLPIGCKDCTARGVCRGGCPSENLTYTGDWDTPTKAWCDTQKVFVEATKRHQDKIMAAKTLRVRRLQKLQLSLTLKKEFDELCELDIFSAVFSDKLRGFNNKMEDAADSVLPAFSVYFTEKLYPVYALFNIEGSK